MSAPVTPPPDSAADFLADHERIATAERLLCGALLRATDDPPAEPASDPATEATRTRGAQR